MDITAQRAGENGLLRFNEDTGMVSFLDRRGLETEALWPETLANPVTVSDEGAVDVGRLQVIVQPGDVSAAKTVATAINAWRRSALMKHLAAHSPRGRGIRTARQVETLAWVLLVLGVGGGVVLGLRTETTCRTSAYLCDETRPFLAQGIAVALLTAFQTLFAVMVSRYIQARLEPDLLQPPKLTQGA